MKSYKVFLLCAGLLLPSLGSSAQTSTAVVHKQGTKPVWMRGEVVHADRNSIVVREQSNPLFIHTFTYSPGVKLKMEALDDQGANFHSGDLVKIRYQTGQTVALKIHGKPSKQ
jgi:hypothetical protein